MMIRFPQHSSNNWTVPQTSIMIKIKCINELKFFYMSLSLMLFLMMLYTTQMIVEFLQAVMTRQGEQQIHS